MPLTEELIEKLTPPVPPPPGLLGPEPPRPELDRDEYGQIRFLWTQLLRRRAWELTIEGDIPFPPLSWPWPYWHVGVGFVPMSETLPIEEFSGFTNVDAVRESNYIFGVTAMVSPEQADMAGVYGVLRVGDYPIPIIVHEAWESPEANAFISHSNVLGTKTCWAKSLQYANDPGGQEGVVTARHVVGNYPSLDLVDSRGRVSSYTAQRFGQACLDAAFLSGPWSSNAPSPVSPVPINLVSKGDRTSLDGAVTGQKSGFITHVSMDPYYSGMARPDMIFSTHQCSRGDSGAMLEVPNVGPIGMHLGRVMTRSGSQESNAISLEQVAAGLRIELYA